MKWLFFFINSLLGVVAIAYPLIWLWQPTSEILSFLPWLLVFLWGGKGVSAVGFQRVFSYFMSLFMLIIAATRTLDTMYWYPVIMSLMMLLIFGGSLFDSQSFIERLARLQTPNLPPEAIRYTRNVTKMWCIFFVFNIVITATLILLEQYQYWAIYSGVIAYILIGILLGGEWVVRQFVKNK